MTTRSESRRPSVALFTLGGPTTRSLFDLSGLPADLAETPCAVVRAEHARRLRLDRWLSPALAADHAAVVDRVAALAVDWGMKFLLQGYLDRVQVAHWALPRASVDDLRAACEAAGVACVDGDGAAALAEAAANHRRWRWWFPRDHQTILDRVREAGCAGVGAYLAARPAVTYLALAAGFVDASSADASPYGVAERLVRLQLTEAFLRGGAPFREAAIDALVRHLHIDMPRGWGVPDDDAGDSAEEVVDSFLAEGFSEWGYYVRDFAPLGAEPPVDTNALRAALVEAAEVGWRPVGPQDPLLRQAFDRAWPLRPA